MARAKRAPQEILDEEHEQVLQRVCAIDVAKEFGQVCIRVPRADGRRTSKVFPVDAITSEVLKLGEDLAGQGIEMVTMESTSDYWRIFYYLLESCGLRVQLVNARDVKNVPGRPKSDTHDCVWLAKLTERGMLRPSFVPPAAQRMLRDYTRTRSDLTRDRTRQWQRLEKLLEDALIKITTVASTITGVSVRKMIEALARGENDPERLADLALGTLRHKRRDLVRALDGKFDEHHGELATILLAQVDSLTTDIDTLTTRIEQLITEPPAPPGEQPGPVAPPAPPGASAGPAPEPAQAALIRLAEIPGVNLQSAQVILAEIGQDMSRFRTAQQLTAWARLTPQLRQSGTKKQRGKTGKGNPYLKAALSNAAVAAAKTDSFLGERYRRLVKRRGKGKALIAVARSILVAVWHLLADPTLSYHELGADFYRTRIDKERRQRHLIQQLEALGLQVTLTPAAA